MMEIGRVVVKLSGRDSGKKAVVVDKIDKNFVLIDGETRRKRCNISHLEPLDKVINVKKNASHEDVKKAFKELGIAIEERKSKTRKERQKSKEEKKETKK